MPRFYYNETTLLADSFKLKFNIDQVFFYDSQQYCINFFWSYEDLKIEMKMSMKMQECLKDLISCIFNFDNFKNIDAKWF